MSWKKSLRVAALLGTIAGPALAQIPNVNLMPEMKSRTPEEIERDTAADKAYHESLRKIPDAKGVQDPWGGVRGADTAVAKPAKPVAKTTQVKETPAKPRGKPLPPTN